MNPELGESSSDDDEAASQERKVGGRLGGHGGLSMQPKGGGESSAIIRDAVLEGEWDVAGTLSQGVFPVIHQPGQGNVQVARYVQLDWELLQQLHNTVVVYGLHLEVARQMLQWLWFTNMTVPEGIKQIMKLIC